MRSTRSLQQFLLLPALASLPMVAILAWSTPADSQSTVPQPAPVWQRIFARPKTIPAPTGNPITPAKITLGRQLFHDTRLSANGRRSCATCHDIENGFAHARPTPLGINGTPLKRSAPSLWNLAWAKHLYWDGRAPTLEAQARIPVEHPNEMNSSLPAIATRLNQDAATRGQFAEAFPNRGEATPDTILAALATYERSLVSPRTRFDRWIAGENSAITPAEHRGFLLFTGRAGCLACHGGWRFTDDKFHDIGLASADPGRSAIDSGPAAARRFKTPGLRGVANSSPYMHDGSKHSLDEVVRHYAGGLNNRPSLAPTIVRDLMLSAGERADLIAFLKAL